jgi:hypothetical protein
MFKQSIIYLLLSIVVVLLARYIHELIVHVNMIYTFSCLKLSVLANQQGPNHIVIAIFLLVVIPVLIVGIPALIYRLITRRMMPYFLELVWCLWLVLSLSNSLLH